MVNSGGEENEEGEEEEEREREEEGVEAEKNYVADVDVTYSVVTYLLFSSVFFFYKVMFVPSSCPFFFS